MRRTLSIGASVCFLATVTIAPAAAHDDPRGFPTQRTALVEQAATLDTTAVRALSTTPCVDGVAAGYACSNVDLHAFVPLADLGGAAGNDIWGWTDSVTGTEYAIMGLDSGTAFVDISDPASPVLVGNLPAATSNSSWRDMKTYADHAFIVSEASGHGMQVFDLTRLRAVVSPPATFTADANYNAFSNSHNIAINEASGFAYAVGTDTCSAGLHMVDISTPTSPVSAGCFSADGYSHDVQCVTYSGPDADHQGDEVCFAANEDTLTIVDVTNKANPAQLSRVGYASSSYTHQVWVTEDQGHLLLDDELDELNRRVNTTTYAWNIADLEAPSLVGSHVAATAAIDHNQYVKGNHTYQANYRAGLRILELTDISTGDLTEVAFFDVYPGSDAAAFNGAWSTYPYFASGVVIVSGIEQGLFVLQPDLGGTPPPTAGVHVGDLDGTATLAGRGNKWSATVTITVHEADEAAVAGVTVSGDFTGARSGSSCTTAADGTCTVTVGRLRSNSLSTTFTVSSLSGDYSAADNHDPDGDSAGTAIVMPKP